MDQPRTAAQREILELGAMAAPGGCILQLPTGTGKTWLALQEIRRTLDVGHRVIYVTPLRAQAEELVSEWVAQLDSHKVGIFTGEYGRPDRNFPTSFEESQLLIMTPERLDACTRFWRSHWHWIPKIDLLVIDELHTIGSRHRGPKLECAISRFRRLNPLARVVGLSATLGNRGELADWIHGTEYTTNQRPIPIHWHRASFKNAEQKLEVLLERLHEACSTDGQALVFVQSRRRAEQVAKAVRESSLSASHHHAGLTHKFRQDVENSFRTGTLKVVVCTPTLEMGVNLPARYVFLYDLQRFDGEGFSPLSVNQVWQRAGRAGRPGYDDEGHVVLFAPTWDQNGKRYEKGDFEPIQSQLNNARALAEQIVTEVGSGMCRTRKQLYRALNSSLAHRQQRLLNVEATLGHMIEAGMLVEIPPTGNESKKLLLQATPLGRVAVRHLLSPTTVLTMHRFISQSPSFNFFDLLLLTSSCEDQEPRIPVDFEELVGLEEHIDQLSSHLLRSSYSEITDLLGINGRRLLTAINTARILFLWTQIGNPKSIAAQTGCFPSEVDRLRDNAVRLLTAILDVFRTIFPKKEENIDTPLIDALSPDQKIESLRFMIESGLPGPTASLACISGLGPKIARRLYMTGVKDLEDLANSEGAHLAQIRGISSTRATKWIELAEELVKKRPTYLFTENNGRLVTQTPRAQSTDIYRVRRAHELTVKWLSQSKFRVTGGTDPHLVTRADQGMVCDCHDHNKGHHCKHLIAVEILLRKERYPCKIEKNHSAIGTSLDLYALWEDFAPLSVSEPRVAA